MIAARPTHQSRLRAFRAQASTAIPVARHRRSDLADGRLGPHRTPYLPSSTSNLKATQTPLETSQSHDAKTLLKDLHFLTWVDWSVDGTISMHVFDKTQFSALNAFHLFSSIYSKKKFWYKSASCMSILKMHNIRHPMRNAFLRLVLATNVSLFSAVLLLNSAHAQSNLVFFDNTSVADLNKSDLDSLYGSIKASLDAGVDGKTSQWSAGDRPAPSATITPTFDKGNSKCATVNLSISSKNGREPLALRYCKSPAGEWALHN
jgi:hypothetical protein